MYTILPRSQGAVLGVELSGKMDMAQEQALIAVAEELIEEHGKISVLIVVGDDVGLSYEAAMADIKWVLANMQHLKKLAIVTDSNLLATLVAVDATFAKMVGIAEKHFDKRQIEAAWKWIEEGQ
ncbi:STAS/SEC14 domain-containing protein [Roseibium salinum]|uniref:STAS/SEC14 domain-containing protein n=1 Tax=Roseibium salinum TaxID=1604349 RepID=A0ABT3R2C4_9HYPH|nr:STAS/SEC14 domain-containing protein [Roseibium sp. DSM 29163]MCX2723349.1 STAS/SEC14 domain-containing protein [Roseibium sp. DSM 29163]